MAGAFSKDGQHLAVGMKNGGFKVYCFHPHIKQVTWKKPFNSAVSDMAYSPNGHYLAIGSHDRCIDVFSTENKYSKICRCAGHSSTITHLDWAADSSVIQSNDQAYEVGMTY